MLRAFVQYTLNVDLNAPVIKDLVEKYKDIEQFNRSITDKYVAICKRFLRLYLEGCNQLHIMRNIYK